MYVDSCSNDEVFEKFLLNDLKNMKSTELRDILVKNKIKVSRNYRNIDGYLKLLSDNGLIQA